MIRESCPGFGQTFHLASSTCEIKAVGSVSQGHSKLPCLEFAVSCTPQELEKSKLPTSLTRDSNSKLSKSQIASLDLGDGAQAEG